MTSEWTNCTVGDVVTLKRGYDLPKRLRQPGNIPVVSSSGVSGIHDSAMVKGPGVVTGRYGTIGNVYFIKEDFFPLNTTLYVKDFKGNDRRFVSYFLQEIDFFSCSNKAAVPGVNRNHLHSLSTSIPPLEEQEAIANCLGSLDDKIEINMKEKRFLEDIAQAAFQSWFVEFEPMNAENRKEVHEVLNEISGFYPDSYEVTELGEIPRGWRISTISDLCQSISSGGTPSRKNDDYWRDGTIEWFKSGELGDSFVMESEERITESGLKNSACKMLDSGDILFALYGATAGKIGVASGPCSTNQAVACLRPLPSIGTPFVEQLLYSTRERLMSIATGAAQQNLYLGGLKEHLVVVPPQSLCRIFSDVIGPLNYRRLNLLKETSVLLSLRNHLLPQLISGSLRIPVAQALLDEVDI